MCHYNTLEHLVISAKVNEANIGGDEEIGRSVLLSVVLCVCVYTVTHNSNDVIAPTAA